jgi:hypothetical protein
VHRTALTRRPEPLDLSCPTAKGKRYVVLAKSMITHSWTITSDIRLNPLIKGYAAYHILMDQGILTFSGTRLRLAFL